MKFLKDDLALSLNVVWGFTQIFKMNAIHPFMKAQCRFQSGYKQLTDNGIFYKIVKKVSKWKG